MAPWQEAVRRLAVSSRELPFSARFRHFRLPPCRPTVVPRYPLEAAVVWGLATTGTLVTPQFRLGRTNSCPVTPLPDHGGDEGCPRASSSWNRDESVDTGGRHEQFGVTFALRLLPFPLSVVADVAHCRSRLDQVPAAGTRAVVTIGNSVLGEVAVR